MKLTGVIRALAKSHDPLRERLGERLLIEVDPLVITTTAKTPAQRWKFENRYLHIYYKSRERLILSGNWDLLTSPFFHDDRYRFIEDLYRNEFDYSKCQRYLELSREIQSGKVVVYKNKRVRLDSEEAVHRYVQGHIAVWQSMREYGYLKEHAKDHICVMIGRNGDLIKELRGRHRLAIAQFLGVKSVLVLVRYIHPLWVRKQRALAGENEISLEETIVRGLSRLEKENQVSACRGNRAVA